VESDIGVHDSAVDEAFCAGRFDGATTATPLELPPLPTALFMSFVIRELAYVARIPSMLFAFTMRSTLLPSAFEKTWFVVWPGVVVIGSLPSAQRPLFGSLSSVYPEGHVPSEEM
jgi:hypothetical protein